MNYRATAALLTVLLTCGVCGCVKKAPGEPIPESSAAFAETDTEPTEPAGNETFSVIFGEQLQSLYADMKEVNSYDRLAQVFDCYQYTTTTGSNTPDSEIFFDGTGTFTHRMVDDFSSYITEDSCYVYRDGIPTAYLDASGELCPEAPDLSSDILFAELDAVPDSIEESDESYRVYYAPDQETAGCYSEEYQSGDSLIYYAELRKDLILDHLDQSIRSADGSERLLTRTTLSQGVMPDKGQILRDHALPSAEDKVTVTLIIDPGTDDECIWSIIMTKGDPLWIKDTGCTLYDDESCSKVHTAGTEDTSADLTLYALSSENDEEDFEEDPEEEPEDDLEDDFEEEPGEDFDENVIGEFDDVSDATDFDLQNTNNNT